MRQCYVNFLVWTEGSVKVRNGYVIRWIRCKRVQQSMKDTPFLGFLGKYAVDSKNTTIKDDMLDVWRTFTGQWNKTDW